jgi:hypothetical protein
MEKVSAFQIPGAIKQSGSGDVPQIDRPEAEGEDYPLSAQALGSQPSGDCR